MRLDCGLGGRRAREGTIANLVARYCRAIILPTATPQPAQWWAQCGGTAGSCLYVNPGFGRIHFRRAVGESLDREAQGRLLMVHACFVRGCVYAKRGRNYIVDDKMLSDEDELAKSLPTHDFCHKQTIQLK